MESLSKSEELDASRCKDTQPEAQASPSAETDANGSETVRCTSCQRDVLPTGKGHCPSCGRFLPANAAAVTHGTRRRNAQTQSARREEILNLLVDERGGLAAIDTITLITLEDYATAAAQLESVASHLEQKGAMTDKGRRRSVVDVYKTFSERVDRLGAEIRGETPLDSTPRPGLLSTPTPALELARSLLSRLANGDALTERELGQLDVLRASMRHEVRLAAPPAPSAPETETLPEAEPNMEDPVAAPLPSIGDQNTDPDAWLKAHDLEAWRVVHYNDPEEVERRNREATAVMLRGRKDSPWL